jgi:hypothetical protein
MGCGASSQVKGPAHSQAESAEAATASRKDSQEPSEHNSKPRPEEVSAASPESSVLPARIQGQADSQVVASRIDAQDSFKPQPDANPHQVPVLMC